MEAVNGAEWPPPGLDALHGRLLVVRSRAVANRHEVRSLAP